MSMLAINERRNITKMIMVIRNNFRSMWAFFHNFECINIETGRILNHESFLIKCKRRLHFICKQQFLCKKKKSRVKCSVHRIVNWIGPALRTPPPLPPSSPSVGLVLIITTRWKSSRHLYNYVELLWSRYILLKDQNVNRVNSSDVKFYVPIYTFICGTH